MDWLTRSAKDIFPNVFRPKPFTGGPMYPPLFGGTIRFCAIMYRRVSFSVSNSGLIVVGFAVVTTVALLVRSPDG